MMQSHQRITYVIYSSDEANKPKKETGRTSVSLTWYP